MFFTYNQGSDVSSNPMMIQHLLSNPMQYGMDWRKTLMFDIFIIRQNLQIIPPPINLKLQILITYSLMEKSFYLHLREIISHFFFFGVLRKTETAPLLIILQYNLAGICQWSALHHPKEEVNILEERNPLIKESIIFRQGSVYYCVARTWPKAIQPKRKKRGVCNSDNFFLFRIFFANIPLPANKH